jgi:hypothetical protein
MMASRVRSRVHSLATARDARSVVDVVGAAAIASLAKVVVKAAADQQVARRRPEIACAWPMISQQERGSISARGSRAPMEAT